MTCNYQKIEVCSVSTTKVGMRGISPHSLFKAATVEGHHQRLLKNKPQVTIVYIAEVYVIKLVKVYNKKEVEPV